MNLFTGGNVPNRCFLRIPQLSQSFVFPVPTCFELCCWHQIQNKYVFTNTMMRLLILFVLFSIETSQIITFHFYSQHPNFFGIRVITNTNLMVTWCHCLLGFPLLSSNWCVHGHIRVCIRLSWPECCDLLWGLLHSDMSGWDRAKSRVSSHEELRQWGEASTFPPRLFTKQPHCLLAVTPIMVNQVCHSLLQWIMFVDMGLDSLKLSWVIRNTIYWKCNKTKFAFLQ